MTLLLQFWFWLTPIVYPLASLPDWARAVLAWNPMAVLVSHYQTVLLYQRAPDAPRGSDWPAWRASRLPRCGWGSRRIGAASAKWRMSSRMDDSHVHGVRCPFGPPGGRR